MKILNSKIYRGDGIVYGSLWVSGRIPSKEVIYELSEFLKPYKLLSLSVKEINGFTGRETQINFFAAMVKELEVGDETEKA